MQPRASLPQQSSDPLGHAAAFPASDRPRDSAPSDWMKRDTEQRHGFTPSATTAGLPNPLGETAATDPVASLPSTRKALFAIALVPD